MKPLILVILSLFAWTASATATYKSFDELLNAFYKAGIDTVIDIPFSAYSESTIFVFTPEVQSEKGLTLGKFSRMTDSAVRVPAFDYVYADPLIGNTQIGEGWVIADKFLCFKFKQGFMASPVVTGEYIRCLTFPRSVSEVLRQVETTKASGT